MNKIIAVASGKGGVGKSTVAVNLAVALANNKNKAKKIALIDVDFYGPSVPILMGGGEPQTDDEGRFIPANRHNVKYVSIAFFLKNPDDAIVWRGPMFSKAIKQLFEDGNWGDIDICIVDLPPGTGDAQISLSQLVKLAGVLMVTTPQEISLSDVRRAVNMFKLVNVPVLGIIENMSGFVAPSGERFDIFGSGGGRLLADNYGLNLLTTIPIDIKVREGGDRGEPIALCPEHKVGEIYRKLGEKVLDVLEDNSHIQTQLVVEN